MFSSGNKSCLVSGDSSGESNLLTEI